MPSSSSSDKPNKQYPLEELDSADKILYVFHILYTAKSQSLTPLRHSQITDQIANNAGKTTYKTFVKSSRTYYKKYNTLIQQNLLKKVKEHQTGNNYNAYIITQQGLHYIQHKIEMITQPPNLKRDKNSIPKIQNNTRLDDLYQTTSVEQVPKQNSFEEAKKTVKSQINSKKIHSVHNNNNNNSKSNSDPFDTSISSTSFPEQMLSTSYNSAKTIDMLLENMQKLSDINDHLQTRLHQLELNPNSNFYPQSSSMALSTSPASHINDTIEEMENFEIDNNPMDESDYIIDQEDENDENSSLKTKSNNENPINSSSIFLTGKKQKLRQETITLPPTPPPIIPKTPSETFQELLSQITQIKDITSLETWQNFTLQQFPASLRQEFSIQLFQKFSITEVHIDIISAVFHLSEQDIADLINTLEHSQFSRDELQLLGDKLVQQIIEKTKTSRFALNDVISIGEKKISYDLAIRNYLKNLFIHHQYQKALAVLADLKQVSPHLEEDYLILQLKIYLNLRTYDKIEAVILQEKILERSWKDDLIIFLIFRCYYEQHAYNKITAPESHFPEKLKDLALADDQILNDYDTILTPRKIHKIFTNLIPDFHQCSPQRDTMITYYTDKLKAGVIPYYFFAIHFIYWVKNYEQNDPRIQDLLLAWWSGAKKNSTTLNTYLTLKEEIVGQILNESYDDRLKISTDDFEQELRQIQTIRTQNAI